MFHDNDFNILIKTKIGFENLVANLIKELDPNIEVLISPRGFKGLLLVKTRNYERDRFIEILKNKVIEAEKIIPIDIITRAEPSEICNAIKDYVKEKISKNETFAVRTTRRGKHKFTSIDVNVIVGECIRRETKSSVNLRYPDKIVFVEIIQDKAYISIVEGSFEYHKYSPEKKEIYNLFRRIAVIQMPYLGPVDAVIEMGKRIGREVQNFEVRELVIAFIGEVEAPVLSKFIDSILEGINSRYRIQERSYSRKPYKVPIYVADLYQLVRSRGNEVIIVFEPEGKYIGDVKKELVELVLKTKKRVNLLFGAREGIPTGIYRYADLIVDIAPGITLSTDYAAAAGLIALSTVLYDVYRELIGNESFNTCCGKGGKT